MDNGLVKNLNSYVDITIKLFSITQIIYVFSYLCNTDMDNFIFLVND